MSASPTRSSFLQDKTKALYQPWSEEAFQADIYVRHMTSVQRWMYRTLCQAAFYCSERPYLPDNDAVLWMLAGCETLQQWLESGGPVRAMFIPVEIDGVRLLSRKRLTDDWTRIQEALAKHKEVSRLGGQASARRLRRSTQVEQESSDSPQDVNGTLTNGEPPVDQRSTELNQRNGTEPTNPPPLRDGGEVGLLATPMAKDKSAGRENQPGVEVRAYAGGLD